MRTNNTAVAILRGSTVSLQNVNATNVPAGQGIGIDLNTEGASVDIAECSFDSYACGIRVNDSNIMVQVSNTTVCNNIQFR